MDIQYFKSAVDGAFDHIVITDLNGIIIYANSSAEKLTGFSFKEMQGNTPALWGQQMEASFYKKMWNTIKTKKEPFVAVLKNKRKNGNIYYAEIRINPIFGDNGNIKFFLGIERDITAQVEMEQLRGDFISIASHQLKTPLTTVKWYLEVLMRDDNIEGDQLMLVTNAYSGAQRMSTVVNDLLNVSRLDSKKIKVTPEPIQLEYFLLDIISNSKPLIHDGGGIDFKKPSKELPRIPVDRVLLSQVVQNLITNAISYTPDSKKCHLIIEIRQDGKNCIISIQDNGIGIPNDVGDKIFEKFFREKRAQKQDTSGSGLGLYICKKIMEAGGGKIWFESEENKGTTFYLSFPMKGMKTIKGEKGLA